MAPNVPYSPVPSVAPTGQGISGVSVATPSAAFGADVSQAVSNLGRAVDKAGDEIFARGHAMQELFNHSEAQRVEADYIEATAGLHADYQTKQGRDAVDAYPGYIKSLKEAREKYRDTLASPAAQKLFDSSTLTTMSRTIFSGAGHAATENKKYALDSSQAKISALNNKALISPEDQREFDASLQQVENEARQQGALLGKSEESIAEDISQQKSKLWTQRIDGLTKAQPYAASKMLDDAAAKGAIRGEDIAKVSNKVRQAMYTVGARNISNTVLSGNNDQWGSGTVDIKRAREAIGQIESGGRYDLVGVETRHGRALGKYQVMEKFLPEYLANAGLPNMTPADYLRSPAIQDQVFDANFSQRMKKTGNANDAASMWLTGKPLAEAGDVRDAHGTNAKEYVRRFNVALARTAPLADKVAAGQKIANEQSPNDPLFADYTTARIESDNNRILAVKRDTDYNNKQTVEGGLIGGTSGKLPTTLEELKADPDTAAAWDALPASQQRTYLGVLSRNAKGDTSWTDEKLRSYQQVKGMAQADPAKFLEADVVSMDLPMSARKELIGLQGKLKANAEGDPRVTKALRVLGPELNAAGISKKTDETGYYQFVGSLQDALQDWQEENKKAPTAEDVRTIGTRLLQQKSGTGWFGTDVGAVPTFQVPVPEKEAERIKALPAWADLGIVPTDAQIQRVYTRKLYQELYGGKPAKPTAPSPKVPISQ